ncbi:short-chain dehydrogenase [Niastella yeongjuensis]|uniref:Short-chain dehydrogenase n=1 Tax=Niastella yeongjuensis TaxID=354355 RepID=A0A1V9EMB6_9BACT|nr:glucose 1-dehydrogenase [Niastella yeongjuensis]OQP47287.1 short-chain dehydrogenase [Niastella yeongjuensis]SEN77242.1 NAD(P)-dependent dehydrogenase, short-chain alcohol dehydrogenase family [Niastella yeongjuensis]
MEKFSNKVAIVTGGNSGIGYATAKDLVAQGATVIITGRRKEAIEKAAKEIGAIPFVADQANITDTEELYKVVQQKFGKVDILFINAGIVGSLGSIENMSEENFDNVMGINFKGAYFTLSKFIPLLPEGASVVILSSIVAATYNPNSSVYQASKAALNSIAKTAAAELAPKRIRVNIVSPGPTQTEVLTKIGLDETAVQNLHDHILNTIPLKKIGTAKDVAKLVTYLSDEGASFITGSEFVIDGGLTL